MAKQRKGRKAPSSEQRLSHAPAARASNPSGPLTFIVLVLTVFGIALTTYLSYTALFEAHPAFCSEGSGCDLVQSSRWATVSGNAHGCVGPLHLPGNGHTGVANQDKAKKLGLP